MNKFFVQKVPQIGVNDNEAKVVEWYVSDGEKVEIGKTLCQIETTKSIIDIDAEAGGLAFPLCEVDEEVSVNDPLVLIGSNFEESIKHRETLAAQRQQASSDVNKGSSVTAKAKKLASELGVDLGELVRAQEGVVREVHVREYAISRSRKENSIPERFDVVGDDQREPLVIYGAGAGAANLAEAIDLQGIYKVVCFVDDSPGDRLTHCGLPVFSANRLSEIASAGVSALACGVAQANVRKTIMGIADTHGLELPSIIHPTAFVSVTAKIGRGCYVKAGAIIDSNCIVGDMCIIDNGATLAHDNEIADCVHFAPMATTGGSVSVGHSTVVGIGASIGTGVTIGSRCIVSVGSAVTKNINDNSVIEGVPGRVIGVRK